MSDATRNPFVSAWERGNFMAQLVVNGCILTGLPTFEWVVFTPHILVYTWIPAPRFFFPTDLKMKSTFAPAHTRTILRKPLFSRKYFYSSKTKV